MRTFKEFVIEEREKLGLSARSLSLKLDKSHNYIYLIEKGEIIPDYQMACKILDALRVDVENQEEFLSQFDIKKSDDEPSSNQTSNLSSYDDKMILQNNKSFIKKLIDDKFKPKYDKEGYLEALNMLLKEATNEEYLDNGEIDKSLINKEVQYKYGMIKQKELSLAIDFINTKLEYYLRSNFNPEDYENSLEAEKVITTLNGLFQNASMFQFFIRLMSIPIQTINKKEAQEEILQFVENKCCFHYFYNTSFSEINDDIYPNKLELWNK